MFHSTFSQNESKRKEKGGLSLPRNVHAHMKHVDENKHGDEKEGDDVVDHKQA